MHRKTQLIVFLVAITACARLAGTPAQSVRGKWGLRQESGKALPVLYRVYAGDSSFLLADTLSFDGRDAYSETLYIGTRDSRVPLRVTYPGNYQAHGDQVVLYRFTTDVPIMPTTAGVRIGRTLLFPAYRDPPTEVYDR